ncbi:hypothetical protein B0H66DRAFT_607323 [Apodospora peruviana]|uniref:Uncharacterized protein n=1 Tax=Apodospora peruviana TaxID=516989 RepID=A0AAE0HW90_9PEZI|nr:hypothetical protein B0H66DRAFT_607323 [Apodospora peruviana]
MARLETRAFKGNSFQDAQWPNRLRDGGDDGNDNEQIARRRSCIQAYRKQFGRSFVVAVRGDEIVGWAEWQAPRLDHDTDVPEVPKCYDDAAGDEAGGVICELNGAARNLPHLSWRQNTKRRGIGSAPVKANLQKADEGDRTVPIYVYAVDRHVRFYESFDFDSFASAEIFGEMLHVMVRAKRGYTWRPGCGYTYYWRDGVFVDEAPEDSDSDSEYIRIVAEVMESVQFLNAEEAKEAPEKGFELAGRPSRARSPRGRFAAIEVG